MRSQDSFEPLLGCGRVEAVVSTRNWEREKKKGFLLLRADCRQKPVCVIARGGKAVTARAEQALENVCTAHELFLQVKGGEWR
jgi:hypothetical protein